VASGGAGAITVAAPPGCAWTASTNAEWITVATPAGNSNGVVNYKVSANTLPSSREGTVTIAGRSVTISQDAISCSYLVGAKQSSFPEEGGKAIAAVSTTDGCAWSASADQKWVTLPPPTGVGSGEFVYVVDRCGCLVPGTTANIAVGAYGRQVLEFRITRAGFTCEFQNPNK
jgi:Putative binding domain, N-terminal